MTPATTIPPAEDPSAPARAATTAPHRRTAACP
jgi:hypothetical protein